MVNLKFNDKKPINFKALKWSQFIPAFHKAAQECIDNIEKIKKNPASFENTILGLENCNQSFSTISSLFSSLVGVNKDPKRSKEIDKISNELNKISTKISSKILYDQALFLKVQEVYNQKKLFKGEDLKLLEESYKLYLDNGIHLPKEKQKRLNQISEAIGKIGIKIESNLQKEPLKWTIHATETEILGIPEDCLALARELAKKSKVKGYLFSVDEANYITLLDYAQSQRLRVAIFQKFKSLGSNKNTFNNFQLIRELLSLRKEQAQILGHKDYASLVLKDRMVKNIKTVDNFFKQIEPKVRPMAKKETNLFKALAKKDNIQLTQADESFYEKKAKEDLCQLDLNEIRDYFSLNQVWAGLQKFLFKLYGIKFEKVNFSTYHSSVDVYKVTEKGKTLGVFYMDWYSRPEKQAGAWMSPIIDPSAGQIPFILVVNNFIRPSKNQATLLSLYDVKTLFHEVGHALHVLFSKSKYESLGGINVAWDFVELPSQIMENFVCEEVVLNLIAKHYKTKKSLPKDYIQKIKKMNKILNASSVLAYLGLGKLDLYLHQTDPSKLSFKKAEALYQKYRTSPAIKGTNRISNFSHILDGGYAVGYYSYQWAEMLDSNCYEIFSKNGVLSKTIAKKFREKVLSVGGTQDELVSFKNFTGHDPKILPYLKKHGLTKT